MARATQGKTQADPHNRSVKARAFQFLMPFAASPGVFLALGMLRWTVIDNVPALVLYAAVAVVVGGALLAWVWHLSAHREMPIRMMLAATIGFAAIGAVITLAVGFEAWWARTFITAGEALAAFWSISRINALRKDTTEKEQGEEDNLRKELGLDGVRFSKAKVIRDAAGDIARIEIDAKNKPGGTAKPIQDAVPGLESLAGDALGSGVPIGRSRAVPDGPSRTKIVIITKDLLKGLIPYPGPSNFGGPITAPLVIGQYEDQELETIRIAGGHPDAPNPVSSGRMGMTRSGKTAGSHVEKLEIASRNNVALIWLDTVKGAQTAEPLADVFSLMVATDSQKATRTAVARICKLIKARTNLLGSYNFATWNDKASYQLGLPYLDIQLEEADDALQDPQFADDVVFIASKGLSAGVRVTVSLQRMDANSAPSNLRYNLGLNFVYGVGDDYSAGFLLTDPTIAAGAHPEYWRQKKPGYHYAEGLSIDDDRAPVPAKSFFAENGQMRQLGAMFSRSMMPLHQVDIDALNGPDGWFDVMRQEMEQQIAGWRANLTDRDDELVTDGVGHAAAPVPAPRPAESRTVVTSGNDGEDDDEAAEAAAIREEVDNVHEDRDFPDDAYEGTDDESHKIDPSKPAPTPAAQMSWGDTKPEAETRKHAIDAMHEAFLDIFDRPVNGPDAEDDERIRRESDHSVTFGPGAIASRYPFRSRPWFSTCLKDMLAGTVPCPPGMSIELVSPGVYRLNRELSAATQGGYAQ